MIDFFSSTIYGVGEIGTSYLLFESIYLNQLNYAQIDNTIDIILNYVVCRVCVCMCVCIYLSVYMCT